MKNTETLRQYLTAELKDSTRGTFNLPETAKNLGIGLDDLEISLRQLVFDKVAAIYVLENPEDVLIDLQI